MSMWKTYTDRILCLKIFHVAFHVGNKLAHTHTHVSAVVVTPHAHGRQALKKKKKTLRRQEHINIIIIIIIIIYTFDRMNERIIILYRFVFLSDDNGFLDMDTINRPARSCVGRTTNTQPPKLTVPRQYMYSEVIVVAVVVVIVLRSSLMIIYREEIRY